uniref:NADH dehydrogenase subunit 6 n=1 Tax=Anodonta anatina TaxID=143294 RepID=U5KJ97_ANOAN|nr:NADH dehydrogenase subunit 6 [Anodonta anatina]AGS17947.1 NADH dehydrogenase subunit 6 [Anodonta anatina]AGS17961.1 NADH dehydrogenase subunit 6 [Anodonta anatina]AGS17975.1 NADH dehydrogenase subunit 6 [Anodonta anatina]AGS17989.1 NADH dehydrogenase subunit 6 [Anodonta anatina]AGS18003.1 NADH dehydrogenase subunit 6 [Anodonta anatina]
MTLMIFSTLWTFITLSMTLPMHPLPLGIMVLMLAFLNCTLIATISPWYSYMLFFIFIGGMLVMFAYIASLSPNMTFSMNNSLMPILLTTTFLFFFKNSEMASNYQTNTSISPSITHTTQALGFLYTQNGITCVIILACMLLFALVASVKICKPKSGALRPFF